jgi:hypothetical protein
MIDIVERAWSGDGYLDRQEFMYNVPYGSSSVGEKGCGFIAGFNALKAIGLSPNVEQVYQWFVSHLIFKGKIGTNVFQICKFLRENNVKFRIVLGKKQYSKAKVGIMLYYTGENYHWVTYYFDEKASKFRFINADGHYSTVVRYTIDEFLKKHSENCFHYVIKIK